MVDGLINEIAAGTSPFKQAACGAAGEQGFQVRSAAACSEVSLLHARMHAQQLRRVQ